MPSPCVGLKSSFASHYLLDPYFPSAAQVRYREQELLLRCVHAITMEGEAVNAKSRRQRDAKLKRQGIEAQLHIFLANFNDADVQSLTNAQRDVFSTYLQIRMSDSMNPYIPQNKNIEDSNKNAGQAMVPSGMMLPQPDEVVWDDDGDIPTRGIVRPVEDVNAARECLLHDLRTAGARQTKVLHALLKNLRSAATNNCPTNSAASSGNKTENSNMTCSNKQLAKGMTNLVKVIGPGSPWVKFLGAHEASLPHSRGNGKGGTSSGECYRC